MLFGDYIMAKNSLIIFALFLCYFQPATTIRLHKLCTDAFNPDSCQQIARDQDINCQAVISKTDCILDADQGLPTFTVLSAEEAFLGAGLVTPTATVFGEIVEANRPYQTAVIVRAGYLGGFEPLKGLKYCHPGYNHDERLTRLVLEQLDWKVINLSCSDSKTLTEQKFEALSSFFGPSCRPGRWTEDDELDARLKSQYSSLCELCGPNRCNTKYVVPLNESLQCLTDNRADVAFTALNYAEAFFSIGANAQDFKYLCPNGSLAPSSSPCTWTNQLNRLLLTSSDSVFTMQSYIQSKLPSFVNSGGDGGVVEQHLALLLQLSKTDRINLFTSTPLRTFVSKRRSVPPTVKESTQCGLTLNWSVTNELERNKCAWLQQASLNAGLQPVISCVLSDDNDTISNFLNIQREVADIAFADSNFGYIARRKNLTAIAYPETDAKQLSKIVIVVKNDTTWYNTELSNKALNFQGKRICLPEYGGKEWLAFINYLRSKSALANSCDYGQIFSDFVGESCAPGANAKDLDIPNTNTEKLCSNCYPVDVTIVAKYCNADALNKYYDSFGALTCLLEGNGDYAVIGLNDLPRTYLNNFEAHKQFKVVSNNGSLADYPGFQVDEGAPIAIITAGEVIVKNGTAKYNDIVLYLKGVEFEFGQHLEKPFKVFERFNRTKDLLFPDSTPGLTFDESTNSYVKNQRTLLINSEICGSSTGGGSVMSLPAILTTIVMTSLLALLG